MFKVEPRFINKTKLCDYPNCNNHQNLITYENDLGINICFCYFHFNNPYENIISLRPVFNKRNYIISTIGKKVCEFIGCREVENLKFIYNGHFCQNHLLSLFSWLHIKIS